MAFGYTPAAAPSDSRLFHKFPQLPPEIQRLIWEAASAAITRSFAAPRVVRLDLVLLSPHMGLLHACSEARAVFFGGYRYESGLSKEQEGNFRRYFRRQMFLFSRGELSMCRKVKCGMMVVERWTLKRRLEMVRTTLLVRP